MRLTNWHRIFAISVAIFVTQLEVMAADGGITVTLKETCSPISDDPQQKGLIMVERKLQIGGNLIIRYRMTVDQNNRPIIKKYGDYFLSCGFPGWRWNWDLEYFLDVSIIDESGKSLIINRAVLQEGIYVLEQGEKGMADLVWRIPNNGGQIAVRMVKFSGEMEWLYVQILLENAPKYWIKLVRLGCYPFITTGPPERQRCVSTLLGMYQLTDSPMQLSANSEWGLVLHNRNAHENGGCILVFDPEEIQSVAVGGTYGVSVYLSPKERKSVISLALGYFWDIHYKEAVKRFRKDAPNILSKIRKIDWTARLDFRVWQNLREEIEEMVSYPALRRKFGEEWRSMLVEIEGIVSEIQRHPGDEVFQVRQNKRQFLKLLQRVQQFKESLYDAAINALIEKATEVE